MLVENARGDRLLQIFSLDESQLLRAAPLTHALVVARHGGRCLVMLNRHKRCWELAGGIVEPGESARACAARELYEETGQECAAEALELLGVMRFQLQPGVRRPESRVEHGALYRATIDEPAPFAENEEAAAICFWDGVQDIGEVDAIDAALARGLGEASSDASLELTPASAADEPFARRLNHAAYRDVVIAQFGAWDEADQDARFAEKWSEGSYEVVRHAGVPVGALWRSRTGDGVFVNDIQVLPGLQTRGIGTAVLQRVIADARAQGLPVELRVLHANRARALYERLGFVIHGQTEIHHLMRRAP